MGEAKGATREGKESSGVGFQISSPSPESAKRVTTSPTARVEAAWMLSYEV